MKRYFTRILAQLRVVARGNLQAFLKEDFEEKKCPENGTECCIDYNKVLTASQATAQRQPHC